MFFLRNPYISKIYTLKYTLSCSLSSYVENKIGLIDLLNMHYFWQSVYVCSSMDLKIGVYYKNSGFFNCSTIWCLTQKWMVFVSELVQRKKTTLEFTDAGAEIHVQ